MGGLNHSGIGCDEGVDTGGGDGVVAGTVVGTVADGGGKYD